MVLFQTGTGWTLVFPYSINLPITLCIKQYASYWMTIINVSEHDAVIHMELQWTFPISNDSVYQYSVQWVVHKSYQMICIYSDLFSYPLISRWVSEKKDVTPVSDQRSYVFLALTHRYEDLPTGCQKSVIMDTRRHNRVDWCCSS